jgi:hypothetical protein
MTLSKLPRKIRPRISPCASLPGAALIGSYRLSVLISRLYNHRSHLFIGRDPAFRVEPEDLVPVCCRNLGRLFRGFHEKRRYVLIPH